MTLSTVSNRKRGLDAGALGRVGEKIGWMPVCRGRPTPGPLSHDKGWAGPAPFSCPWQFVFYICEESLFASTFSTFRRAARCRQLDSAWRRTFAFEVISGTRLITAISFYCAVTRARYGSQLNLIFWYKSLLRIYIYPVFILAMASSKKFNSSRKYL